VSTSEYTATAVTYIISACALWIWTRKSRNRYIRWQWRRRHWILLRLLVVVLALHGLFALLDVHPAVGFLFVGAFAVFSALGDYTGVWTAVIGAIGWILYQWLFWLPSRRQLILRNPRPVGRNRRLNLVGAEAVAASDLKPSGIITLQGMSRSARSQFGFITKGEKVVIESIGDFEVIVRKVETNAPAQ
jgi:membrane-bound ClpP family serine protease